MSALTNITHEFEGTHLTTITYKGRPCWIAREIGRLVGYGNDGGKLVKQIGAEWHDEFMEGTDYLILRGKNLADFKNVVELGTESVPSSAPLLMLLLESGLHLVCIKTNKPIGRRLRRFLVDEVLPQLTRDGRYLPEREVVDGEVRHVPAAEVNHLALRRRHAIALLADSVAAGVLSEKFAKRYALHSLALIDGTAPPAGPRLIDVSSFLQGKGLSRREIQHIDKSFGRLLSDIYLARHGRRPKKAPRICNGSERCVNCYTEEDLPLFEEAYERWLHQDGCDAPQLRLLH